jgi:hypothetical protein
VNREQAIQARCDLYARLQSERRCLVSEARLLERRMDAHPERRYTGATLENAEASVSEHELRYDRMCAAVRYGHATGDYTLASVLAESFTPPAGWTFELDRGNNCVAVAPDGTRGPSLVRS